MALDMTGPWNEQQVEDYLKQAVFPVRLSCVGSDGYPRVVSLWYRFDAGSLLCVTHRDSSLASILRRDNKVGFEISPNEPPYMGLRGQGDVSVEPLGDQSVLQNLLDRYLGDASSSLARWLLSRADEELLISLKPRRVYTWDYSGRMTHVA